MRARLRPGGQTCPALKVAVRAVMLRVFVACVHLPGDPLEVARKLTQRIRPSNHTVKGLRLKRPPDQHY